jgi:hypothetical protein
MYGKPPTGELRYLYQEIDSGQEFDTDGAVRVLGGFQYIVFGSFGGGGHTSLQLWQYLVA